LASRDQSLGQITTEDAVAFLKQVSRERRSKKQLANYRYELRKYLRWLESKGLGGPFQPEQLLWRDERRLRRKSLPEEAQGYLSFLAPTRRPGTVALYRHILLQFHGWLAKEDKPLAQVDRDGCLAWIQHLHRGGLHPATRVGWLVAVRRYLDWLWERGIVKTAGREMILAGDFPKKPDYLPRPLPPDADQQLQIRLRNSGSSLALGLYLMRRTGLRIGELQHLELDCIRTDFKGTRFLKVPVGKLHNERLVPLDEAALAAVTELLRRAPANSRWLIPNVKGGPVLAARFRVELLKASEGLSMNGRITPHRLRHTFATSLMNGGMSLLGIMRLLGHRDFTMTLRYTLIADETLGREYFESLSRIAERYALSRAESSTMSPPEESDPKQLLEDTIRWVNKHLRAGSSERTAKLLVRRLEAIRDQLEHLRTVTPAPQE
jgi:site-specific recombinase XerD